MFYGFSTRGQRAWEFFSKEVNATMESLPAEMGAVGIFLSPDIFNDGLLFMRGEEGLVGPALGA